MKIQSLIFLSALMFNVAHAFTTSNHACQRKALITSRKTTTIKAAASSEGAKKKKTTKKKAPVKKEVPKEEVETVRKPEFVASIAEKTGMSKTDSEAALAAVIETITEVRRD